jgi:hypothetical protein
MTEKRVEKEMENKNDKNLHEMHSLCICLLTFPLFCHVAIKKERRKEETDQARGFPKAAWNPHLLGNLMFLRICWGTTHTVGMAK